LSAFTPSRRSPRWWPFAIAVPIVTGIFIFASARATGRRDPQVLLALALVAAVVVSAVWLARPSWTICAGLVLSMFGSHWQSLGLPPSVAPDRLMLAAALIAILVRAPGARDLPRIRFRPLYALMYVAGAYAVASAIAAGTLTSHAGFFTLLDRMGMIDWVVFIIAPAAFSTAADRRVLLATLVGMGIYLGWTGIFEIVGPHSLVFPRYINNPHVGIHFGRARGPFTEAVVEGLALFACVLASLIALRTWRRLLPRALAVMAILTCMVSLLLTFQRSDWLGVIVAAALIFVCVRELRRYALPIAAAVALGVIFAFAAFPAVRGHASARLADIGTIQGRQAVDGASLLMVETRPLIGFGWGRFQDVLPGYFRISNSYSVGIAGDLLKNPVHNVYLSIATELGLIGLALWLLVLFVGVGGAVFDRMTPSELRPWQIALGALFVMWLAIGISAPLSASFESFIIWLWAAVIVGADRRFFVPAYQPRRAPIRHLARAVPV
jgi:O-antigen ligase